MAVGDLLAGAKSDPGDQRLLARHWIQIGIGGDEAKRVQSAVQDREVRCEVLFPGARQPVPRSLSVGEGLTDVDDRGAARRDRSRLRLR